MGIYGYKITRDYGFAPNPFGTYCTLACCKPHVRKKAIVGDWVIGTGAIENNLLYHLIFLMKVTEKLTFQEYWDDVRFDYKKPRLNGSIKQLYGDNIYHQDGNEWCQLDSHHSLPEGVLNDKNLKQDLSGNYVLISNEFIYLGDKSLKVPEKYIEICPTARHRDYITVKNEELAEEFITMIFNLYNPGLNGKPINWKEHEQLQLL
ncbi:hypothetical protein [Pedobacter sp. FW305-3-2-15-E-R2A2]|uniref:Nmad2 family putative nucleotide modification protein n=1 Tax=Pedobacter sp. FW305-3-2-15-E-R2A2 TaxID=3140251 RepID=UPI0031408393